MNCKLIIMKDNIRWSKKIFNKINVEMQIWRGQLMMMSNKWLLTIISLSRSFYLIGFLCGFDECFVLESSEHRTFWAFVRRFWGFLELLRFCWGESLEDEEFLLVDGSWWWMVLDGWELLSNPEWLPGPPWRY